MNVCMRNTIKGLEVLLLEFVIIVFGIVFFLNYGILF